MGWFAGMLWHVLARVLENSGIMSMQKHMVLRVVVQVPFHKCKTNLPCFSWWLGAAFYVGIA